MIILCDRTNTTRKIAPHTVTNLVKGYPSVSIIGGEFAVIPDITGVGVSTLLGSCVSIMLYDRIRQVGAMNHFLLPVSKDRNDSYKYGLYSVESMINQMMKLGCEKRNMEAKIAGGANILRGESNDVGFQNVEFAKEFCRQEKINIVSMHVLGENGRVVFLAPGHEAFIRHVDNRMTNERIRTGDEKLVTELGMRETKPTAAVTLF